MRSRCIDCHELTDVFDLDEDAVCSDCVMERRAAEERFRRGDGQAGARFVGKQREAAMRRSAAEELADRLRRTK